MSESSVKSESESENGSFARDALLPFLVGLSGQSRQSRQFEYVIILAIFAYFSACFGRFKLSNGSKKAQF